MYKKEMFYKEYAHKTYYIKWQNNLCLRGFKYYYDILFFYFYIAILKNDKFFSNP